MIRQGNNKGRQNDTARKEGENQQFHVKHDAKNKMQVVSGMRPVMEAIDAGKQIDKIFVQSNLDGKLAQELKTKIRESGVPMQYVPVEKLNRLSEGNHQGVVALMSAIEYKVFLNVVQPILDRGETPFVVLLDHVTDVRNFGAIVRTAECAGVDAVIVPDKGGAQINEDAIKCSSGALLRMPICREGNFKTLLNLARQLGMQICAATEKGATEYTCVDLTKPTMLVMGAEDTGISNEVLKMSDVRAKLPICGEVQSLNVSVAAGVFMYEMRRQRMLGK